MKKMLFACVVLVAIACNNNSSNETVADSAVNDNSAVENVNGNIPDSTNSITIDGGTSENPAPKDTTRKN